MQAANEELETSKEELQSLNEELQTINSQLEQKVSELEAVNNDLSNFLANSDVAMIFLDREALLAAVHPGRHAADADTRERRRAADLRFRPQFRRRRVVARGTPRAEPHLAPLETEVQDHEGHWFLRRIVPYRTDGDRIDGVVMVFRRDYADQGSGAGREIGRRRVGTARRRANRRAETPPMRGCTRPKSGFATFSKPLPTPRSSSTAKERSARSIVA